MKDDPFDPNARLAGEFDRWVEDGRAARLEAGHSVIADAVIARMPIRGRSSVLDLSCGTGWATRRLAGRAHHGRVWGVDVSPAMIRIARNDPRNPPHVDFEVAPAEALPFPADTFDAVFSMEAFYYFPDVPAALAECRRVLKPSGELDVVIHLFWENELSRRWPELLEVPVTLLPAADWVKMCQAVGFSAAYEERVPDSTPVRDEEAPSKFFRTPRDLRKFREQGALRVVAVK